ncbi:hypothetical protein CGCF415_v015337 [Colletotrichum fructicola]|uniref:Uncharacterized protein n=1 Tax=Colletotrichum fructicola (strain Nara gc5) TaxID=1213859 RepID=A0A7J6IZA5_COLFN|nr:hypothetical protein CGGC5_v009389 [Colletotrichum fructicola Nara gc5]KAF4885681.1 hypothetical protein CGCF415_v015337 [Colletotrichum fructicola]KAF4894183.1 hypothetical protein CGCFRS4_v006683 [Colletotrichum fructicola]KAF4942531.1 hypothetical protein CGCF245_v000395 [Colletotrichum fructicola]
MLGSPAFRVANSKSTPLLAWDVVRRSHRAWVQFYADETRGGFAMAQTRTRSPAPLPTLQHHRHLSLQFTIDGQ